MGRKQKRHKFSPRNSQSNRAPNSRRLHVEHLEDRRLLAAVTVSNILDVVNGDTSSIANLIASPGDDGIALREAIEAANTDAAADTIDFDAGLSGDTLLLTEGQFVLTNPLTIDASSLTGNLTIDAEDSSRIFYIPDATLSEFTFRGLTLTGGNAIGDSGGALLSYGDGNVTFDQTTINGNSASISGGGFAVFSSVTLTNSTVSGNSSNSDGGGLAVIGNVTLNNSTVSGNSAGGGGGGIFAGASVVTLNNSTLSGNSLRWS